MLQWACRRRLADVSRRSLVKTQWGRVSDASGRVQRESLPLHSIFPRLHRRCCIALRCSLALALLSRLRSWQPVTRVPRASAVTVVPMPLTPVLPSL